MGTGDTTEMKEYKLTENIGYVIRSVCRWDKNIIFILSIAVVFNAVFPYRYPIISRQVISCILEGRGYPELIYVVSGLSGVFLLLKVVYSKLNLSLWWRFFYVKSKFAVQKMEKVMNIPFGALEDKSVLDKMEKAEQSVQGTNGAEGMLHSIQSSMVCAIKIVMSAAVMSILSPVIAAAALALSLIDYKVIARTKRLDIDILYGQMAPVARRSGYWTRVSYDRDYAKEIRIFGLKDWIFERLHAQNETARHLLKASKRNWFHATFLNHMISLVQKGVVYGYIIHGTYTGKISIADFIFYTGCIMILFDAVSELLDNFSTLNKQSIEVTEYRSFMEHQFRPQGECPIEPIDHADIEFRHVYFRYEGQREWAVEDLNLSIHQGEKIAVVGRNGSGKSTLIKLLCRLYEPTKGEILLNGININTYHRNDYYRLIAPVFQEVIVFALSLRENIAFGETGREEGSVLKAVTEAGLKERVSLMKKGLDSEMLKIMDSDGEELSGGEKQKIAVARSVYKTSVIDILDEPTAAMDPIAERDLYESMNELMKNRIGVFISHRLSSTRFCDQILYMDGGKILERGDHSQLMAREGEYSKLYMLQAQYYAEEEHD